MADKNNTYLDAGWEPDEGWIPTERDWYIQGLKNKTLTLGEAYVDSQSGELCVSASCVLAHSNAELLGTDTSANTADLLSEHMKKFKVEK